MKKRVLCILLTLVLLCSLLSVTAMAETDVTRVHFDEATGTLTVSGAKHPTVIWDDFKSEIKHAVFTDEVEWIPKGCFSGCTQLESVAFPTNTVSIGGWAFQGCTSLGEITVPEGVKKLNQYVFSNCTSLKVVNLPESLESIEEKAFHGCTSLESIYIPAGVTYIGATSNLPYHEVFSDCTSLESITVDPENTEFCNDAYGALMNKKQSALIWLPHQATQWQAPESLKVLWFTFEDHEMLESVEISGGVKTIPENMFSGCRSLETVVLSEGLTKIGSNAFYDCDSLEEIIIPNGVEEIGANAFKQCNYLYYISLPASITKIGSGAFADRVYSSYGYASTHFFFSGNEEQWNDIAFAGDWIDQRDSDPVYIHYNSTQCAVSDDIMAVDTAVDATCTETGLTEGYHCPICNTVLLPQEIVPALGHTERVIAGYPATCMEDGLTDGSYCVICETVLEEQQAIPDLGGHTFENGICTVCNAVDGVIVLGTGECGPNLQWTVYGETGTLVISGTGEMEDYPMSPPWSGFYMQIKKIVIQEGVTSIDHLAFEQMPSLTEISISSTVTLIDGQFCIWCPLLTKFSIDADNASYSVDSSGVLFNKDKTLLFRAPEGLAGEYVIPDTVVIINDYAFQFNNNLTKVTIPDSVTTIGKLAFAGTNLDELYIGENVTLGEDVFASAGNCKITIDTQNPNYCNDEQYVIFNKDKTVLLHAPADLADGYAIPNTVKEIDVFAFTSCYDLTKMVIPNGVTHIDEMAFEACHDLTYVVIPTSVVYIGHNAFFESGLTDIYYQGSEEQWDAMESKPDFIFSDPEIHFNSDGPEGACTHNPVTVSGKAATCTAAGLTDGSKCSKCGEVLKEQTAIPAKGHTEVIDKAVAATCTTAGKTEGKHCSVCNTVIAAQKEVAAKGHTTGAAVKENNVAATCDKDGGYDEVIYCSVCKTEMSRTKKTVPAVGHKFSNGKCSVCGAKDPNYVAPTPTPTPTPAPTPTPVENPFTDVADDVWYAAPVLWAKENNVTGGTSATTFGPDDDCTRAQVVTFLWAANGRPEPKSTENPFTDVKASDWYYKPVLWAVENGITGGTSATTFGPNATCTRAQIATFLYAAEGKPAVSGGSSFKDVADSDWFAKPVIWAAENGVTGGIGDGKFGPNRTCTRAQVVTFLYKVYG